MTTPAPFPQTGIASSNTAENNRFEIKGTATPWPNQTVQGQYLRNNTTTTAPPFAFSIDPSTRVTSRTPKICGSAAGAAS